MIFVDFSEFKYIITIYNYGKDTIIMLQMNETLKKIRSNNLKIKNNETRLKNELEAIKSQGKDRRKFDKVVKESRNAIANIRFSMTYIQAAGRTDIEDYMKIINDLAEDEKRLNAICENLENYLKGEANNA